MQVSDFDFELPKALIAQHPLPERTDSRMLVYERATKNMQHTQFKSLLDWLSPNDLLVFNNSKVMPARCFGHKETGGKVELLVERVLSTQTFLAHMKASKPLRPEQVIRLSERFSLTIKSKQDDLYCCEVDHDIFEILEAIGHIPLPPYIERQDELADRHRYQTVYAKHEGSVAAPTAGLHFDEAMLQTLREKGVELGYVTLHVGAGTFKPVRVEVVTDHRMHSEWINIDETLCEQIKHTKRKGGRVIAVGTTALRALESVAAMGEVKPFSGETAIFIYPPYAFKVVDGLITNFHLPCSTLLMLVSAFVGYDETMRIYREAVSQSYRFFSYGDVSLLL